MAVPPELVWLIERLRSAPSRRERLRLLLEGRRLVRDLSPNDRLVVARELGFDGAEKLVEEIADRGGFSPGPWMKLLEEVEQDGGHEAAGVVRGLLHPETRGAAVSRLLDAASGWVADLDAYRPEPVSNGEIVANGVDDRDLQDGGAGAGPPIDVDGEPLKTDWGEPEPPFPPVEAIELEPIPVEVTPVRPPPPPLPMDEIPSGPDDPAAPETVGEISGADEPTEPAIDAGARPSIAPVEVDGVLAMLAAETRSSARLATLRAVLGELIDADARALERLIDQFPAGWSRRRALETLLRAGLPVSFEDALHMVDTLTRPSEKMWALTTIASTRRLSDMESAALLAAAGSPALARRLLHRIRRSA